MGLPQILFSQGSCHIGGNVSTNAGGLRLLRFTKYLELPYGLHEPSWKKPDYVQADITFEWNADMGACMAQCLVLKQFLHRGRWLTAFPGFHSNVFTIIFIQLLAFFFTFSRLPAWRRTTLVTTWSTFSSVPRALWVLSPGFPYLAQLGQGE